MYNDFEDESTVYAQSYVTGQLKKIQRCNFKTPILKFVDDLHMFKTLE